LAEVARNFPESGPLGEAGHSSAGNVAVFMEFVTAG
jgi:hypothetical protein